MKTLWILNHYAQAPGGPGGLRHFSLAHHLRELGWQVWVIGASTELGTGNQRLMAGESSRVERIDGVPFLWVRASQYKGNGLLRAANMLTYAVNAQRRSMLRGLPRPDVVLGSSVHPLTGAAASRLARRYGVPFIFEVRDLWPETLIAFGRLRRGGIVARALRALEANLYRRAEVVLSVLPLAAEYISQFGVDPQKVVWIPNGIDPSRFEGAPPPEHDGEFTYMYLGAHGQANALEVVLNAMAILERRALPRPIGLRFVGDGARKPALIEKATQLRLSRVSFEPAVPAGKVPEVVSGADAFVSSSLDRPGLYRYGVSMNKLFDYMAAARPTITALDSVNNPVLDAGCGFVVPPENPEALASAMARLAGLPHKERARMALAGRHHVEQNYDYRVLAVRLCQVLDGMTS